MNEIEFKGKSVLWGMTWNPPIASIHLPIESILATADEITAAQTRFTYQEWKLAGKPPGMMSDYNINPDHPEHEHQHGIHHWGDPAPGVTYDPDDPRPHWTWIMGGLAPGEISLEPSGRIRVG